MKSSFDFNQILLGMNPIFFFIWFDMDWFHPWILD